jgi:hypothetical protein
LACPDIPQGHYDITPDFLHQLRAVKKFLDQTGLPLPKLLAFWAEISTVGQKSLYTKLFLTHNLVAIDSVFQADANGNYLTKQPPEKITGHIPVLMAALKLKAEDIGAIMKLGQMPDDAPLTLSNVSFLYRYSLLAKILHIRAAACYRAGLTPVPAPPIAWRRWRELRGGVLSGWSHTRPRAAARQQKRQCRRHRRLGEHAGKPIFQKEMPMRLAVFIASGISGITISGLPRPAGRRRAGTAALAAR